jgi:hypothetical protein
MTAITDDGAQAQATPDEAGRAAIEPGLVVTRALIGAVGAAAFGTVTSDVWRIAANLGPVQLAVLCAATIATAVVALIAAHGLWERTADRRVREQ